MTRYLSGGLMVLCGLLSCEKEAIAPEPSASASDAYHYDRLEGFVQKGPFLNGTAMQVAELQKNLAQTGRNYNTQIVDNRGNFELYDVDFATPYVQLKADGFYYNEVSDETSSARLSLYAVTNLTEHNALNVNLLTTLERARVEYLVSRGSKFGLAKQQAQQEIFDIFEMGDGTSADSELLDISQSGDDNAKLLALSVILQGKLSEAELSELVANISTDIRSDGQLDSQELGTQLINNAVLLKPARIREHLQARYRSMGMEADIPAFEDYIKRFIDLTSFEITNRIFYPMEGGSGPNLLATREQTYPTGKYSLAADLPANTSLRLVVGGANWVFRALQSESGWTYSELNGQDTSRVFTATRTGPVDFEVLLQKPPIHYDYTVDSSGNTVRIPVNDGPRSTFIRAYENDATEPSWTYTFFVE